MPSANKRRVGANDKVRLGFIGVAGRANDHLNAFGSFDDVEIVAICDVYKKHLDAAIAKTGGTARGYSDFRDLLAQKDIDAVVIATPPHWHALIAVAACKAGKDVYCEKPMSRYPAEAKAMVDAAKRYGRVTQDGTQVHATENYRKCVDIVRSGKLGRITSVSNFCTMNDASEGLGNPPDSEPLEGLDWNMWLGPAPAAPFNIGRFRDGMHRYFRDYADSWLHELGPHIVDLPFWALDLGQPTAVSASGGRFATDSIADVPDTFQVLWEFPGLIMNWNLMQANSFHFGLGDPHPGRHNGIIFHGDEATLSIVNYGTPEVVDREGKPIVDGDYPAVTPVSPGHEREFINCIRTREEPSCSFANHLPLQVALNLAHVALNVGRKLHWDAEKFTVVGDRDAARAIKPVYREPWKL